MEIRFPNGDVDIDKAREMILNLSHTTRFDIGGVEIRGGRKQWLKIKELRLKESKSYCGNHPYACPVIPHMPKKRDPKRKYLEGADWVNWNDLINDVFDDLDATANIKTAVCIVRKGRKRRTEYCGHQQGIYFWEWDMDTEDSYYEDWCGRTAPGSEYPLDTPGLYTRANGYAEQCEREAEEYNRRMA